MKYKKIIFMIPLILLGLCGCSPDPYAKFSEYYNASGKGGIEMYAWKNDDEFFTGLLPGTNRLKSVDEIKELQENPCPLEIMKNIITTYSEEERYYCWVCIVSVPPKESELDHSMENTERNKEDISYICNYLGIRSYTYEQK